MGLEQIVRPKRVPRFGGIRASIDAKAGDAGKLGFNLYLTVDGEQRVFSKNHPGHGAWETLTHEIGLPPGSDLQSILFRFGLRSGATEPAFGSAWGRRRGLGTADGCCEWQRRDGGKQPYRIALQDGVPFAFAGLWERWGMPGNEIVESFTIIVTEANELVRPIHDRMPVILDAADYDEWIEGSDGEHLLKPFPSSAMTAYLVSPHVNSPKHDDPACLDPLR